MSFFSLSLSPTISEKIDAKVTNIAFSIWSVQNSATKGIQGMQAVSNLPISACIPWIPLVAEFFTDHIEKATFVTLPSIFSATVGGMKLKFGEEIEKKLIYLDLSPFRWDFQYFCVNFSLKRRRSLLTADKLRALSLFLILTFTGQK